MEKSYFYKKGEKQKMDRFNIKQVKLDLDKLNKEIDNFRFSNGKEPYILMSSETLQLFKRTDCLKFHVLMLNKEKKITGYGYNFYTILINDLLKEGEIELR